MHQVGVDKERVEADLAAVLKSLTAREETLRPVQPRSVAQWNL